MEKPFSAYRGPDPFVFVCYAHEDANRVYPELAWLKDQGVNVWYDEGIFAGRNWRAEIGDSLLGAEHVLFYISASSLASDHCNREINLALDEGKSVVPVYLEEAALTSDLKVGLNRVQALRRDANRDYRRHLLEALGQPGASPVSAAEPASQPSASRWLPLAVVVGVMAVVAIGLWTFYGPDQDESSTAQTGTIADQPAPALLDDRPSIAVLPFVNMSADPEQEYFSDGLAEELINLLARNPELRVVSRGSSFAFKGQDIGIGRIAEQLNAGHVLEGSVRKSGNMVRITAMLTEAVSGAHVWSESFDRPLDDVFAIQDEIAASVAGKLNVTLLALDQRSKTGSTQAYLLYLRARHLLGLAGDMASTIEAERLLNQALAVDPAYVPALTEMARVVDRKTAWDLLSRSEAAKRMKALTLRALEIDPDDPVANAWRGWQATFNEQDPAAGARYYERALAINPNHEDVLRGLVPVLWRFGLRDRALALAEYVVEVDPLCVVCIMNLGNAHRMAGRLEEAEAQFRQALTLSPGAILARVQLGQLLLQKGRTAEARVEFEKLDPAQSYTEGFLLAVLYFEGKQAEFDEAFAEFRRRWPEALEMIAGLYAMSGDADRAFDVLDEFADASGRVLMVGMPEPSSFRAYMDDPRWQRYLKKVGADPEAFAAVEFDPQLPAGARL